MELSKPIREYLQNRIAEIRDGSPGSLSDDGLALMVDGGLGYGCFVSPEGDAFVEEYFEEPTRRDGTRRGQIKALVLGMRRHPVLSELLPTRPEDAVSCDACTGEGFLKFNGVPYFICHQCCGLGWISGSVFMDPGMSQK